MITAIIVDDERKGRETLQKLVTDYCPSVTILGMANSAATAQEMIDQEKPELVFLDVEMPGGTGFDLLERLGKVNFKVVFTTAYGHYAIKAIKYSAFDYLLKPVAIDELTDVVDRLEADKIEKKTGTATTPPTDFNISVQTLLENLKVDSNNRKLVIPDVNGLTVVHTREIVRFESESSYTTIHLQDRNNYIISKHLRHFETILADSPNFYRVHRSHFINLDHVKRYVRGEGGYAIMTDGSQVEISRRKKNEFIELIGGGL